MRIFRWIYALFLPKATILMDSSWIKWGDLLNSSCNHKMYVIYKIGTYRGNEYKYFCGFKRSKKEVIKYYKIK